ncbi:MAG TPA: M56 family metallopeptidase, partial [Longimicrobiales bacterium]
AALLFERGFAHLRIGTRFAWTFALLATLVLPFVPRLLRTSQMPDVVPVFSAPEIVVSATSNIESRFPINPIVAAWLVLSALVLAAYLVSYVRLRRARRGWLPAQVARHDVFLSEGFGPAVFGFVAPRIVLPQWVRDAAHEEQELIVLHESEHIRARDQLQLLLAIIATIAMPWNPLVWIHSRRLRFAIEADCDQRVLAAAPDRARYASLLVSVGEKQMGLLLTPALAEHRNGLEARLNMLATKLKENRWKAAGMVFAGVLLAAVACESRLPQEAAQEQETKLDERPLPENRPEVVEVRELAPTMKEGVVPPINEGDVPRVIVALEPTRRSGVNILEEEYPPLLRDAGVEGTVGLRVHVTNGGEADRVEVTKGSGHDALDQAAMRVAKRMRWGHEGPGKTTDYWTTTSITFENTTKMKTRGPVREPVRAEGSTLPRKIDPDGDPHFTPYTKKPEVRNREVIKELLIRNYPPLLRDAGVGGTVLAWLLIDEGGNVISTKLKESSGHEALDAAGLKVIEQIKFTPAEHNGVPVNVWIQMPIAFKTQ